MEQLQHLWGIAYGFRRKAATWGLFLFAALLAVHVIFGTNGWMAYEKKKAEYRKVTEEVQQIREDNDRVQHKITDLKTNPEAIAKEAREGLHMVKGNERVIYLDEPKKPDTATAQAKPENPKK